MIPGIVAGRPKPSHWLPFTPSINLPFEGPNGSTTITDTTGRSWTRNGNAQISTAQSAVGSSSLLLDGNGDYLQTADNANIRISGDFRMRCYFYTTVIGATKCIASKRPATGNSEFFLALAGNSTVNFTSWGAGGAVVLSISTTSTISTNTWYKCEVRRSGTSWELWLNDVMEASGTESGTPQTNTDLFLIGRDRINAARDWNGYIDDFVMERPV